MNLTWEKITKYTIQYSLLKRNNIRHSYLKKKKKKRKCAFVFLNLYLNFHLTYICIYDAYLLNFIEIIFYSSSLHLCNQIIGLYLNCRYVTFFGNLINEHFVYSCFISDTTLCAIFKFYATT